jgi:hypothetical protein
MADEQGLATGEDFPERLENFIFCQGVHPTGGLIQNNQPGFTQKGPGQGHLLEELEKLVKPETMRSKYWPKAPNALTNPLKEAAPSLRSRGIDADFSSRSGTSRSIILRRLASARLKR